MSEDQIVQMPVEPCCTEAVHIGVKPNEWYKESQQDPRFNIKSARADLIKDHQNSIDRFQDGM